MVGASKKRILASTELSPSRFGELGHVICIGHALYVMIITDFGHPERLLHIPNSLFAATFLGGLVSSGGEVFLMMEWYDSLH